MRIIAVFEKSARIRHIGHLDIQRAFQRGLRRSGLPVAYSNGFNPHILITFASALSTGACGTKEILDVRMAKDTDPDEFTEKMNRAMPPELRVIWARSVDDRHPSLMGTLTDAEYDLLIYDPETAERVISAIPAMMSRDSIPAIRKTKTGMKECDIRPLISELSGAGKHIHAVTTLTEREACKPGMLLDALKREAGIEDEVRMLITRTGLYGRDENGELKPLETM